VTGFRPSCTTEKKKANVAEHRNVFGHVGLLFNEPPSIAELLFIQSSDDTSYKYTVWNGQYKGARQATHRLAIICSHEHPARNSRENPQELQ
jgi:hypothetical protein